MNKLQPFVMTIKTKSYINQSCQLCYNNRLTTYTFMCDECFNSIFWFPPPKIEQLDNGSKLIIQAITRYQFPTDRILKKFKLNCDTSVLPILVEMLKQLQKITFNSDSILVPMPTRNSQLARRGFDPVLIMANYIAKFCNIDVWQEVSMREHVQQQKQLNRHDREHNMHDAFILKAPLPTSNIILFDDISTTGSSLKSLATEITSSLNSVITIKAYCVAF